MVTARPYDSYRNREVTGFLLSLAFAGLAPVRGVCFGGLFLEVNPLLVALTAHNGPAHRAVPEPRC